ncbi:MAG: translocation/assembly module TamB domain-containing protein [Myxococcales bacterium]|nr:translocation/assembly module TamB domain-containing protein [Myxococcales bacterium]
MQPTQSTHILWRILRRIVWSIFVLLVVTLLLIVGVFLFARSEWGQQKILAWVLPIAQQSLSGPLRIGHLRSDLFHHITLSAIELDDREGTRAVQAEQIVVRYDLSRLRQRTLSVTQVHIKGAQVHARHLRDGRLNLAALTVPAPQPTPPSTAPLPLRIEVNDITLQAGLMYSGGGAPLSQAAADLGLTAGLTVSREREISVRIARLALPVSQPLRADLALGGDVTVFPSTSPAGTPPRVVLRDLLLSLNTDGAELNRVVPAAGLLPGALALTVKLSGDLQELQAQLDLTLPKGRAALQARVGLLDSTLPWLAALTLHEVELRSLRKDLPPLRVELALKGTGAAASGQLDIDRIFVQAAHNTVTLRGALTLPESPAIWADPLAATADLSLQIDAPRLDELRATHALLPDVAGALSGALKIDLQRRSLRVVSKLDARGLRGFGASLEQLQADIDLRDLTGRAHVMLHGARVGNERVAHATLLATGSRNSLDLRADVNAQVAGQDLTAALFLHALPTYATPDTASPLTALTVDLRTLNVARGSEQLALLSPARLFLRDLHTAPMIETVAVRENQQGTLAQRTGGQLVLGFADLHIGIAGRYEVTTGRMRARLDVENLDAQHLAFVAAGRTDVPRTHLGVQLQVAGTLARPTGHAQLSGTIDPLPGVVPWQTPMQLSAEVSGSPENPRGMASIRMPAWQLDSLQGDGATLDLTYVDHVLQAQLKAPQIVTEAAPLGRVQLGASVDLIWRGPRLAVDVHASYGDAPWLRAQGSTQISQADALRRGASALPLLPIEASLDMPSFALPQGLPATGRVAVQARISGTVQKPAATATIQASDIEVSTWRVGSVFAHAQLESEKRRMLHVQVAMDPQARLAPPSAAEPAPASPGTLTLHADVPLPFAPTDPALHVALMAKDYRLDYQSPSSSKSALRQARGTLNADLQVVGATPQPLAEGSLRLSQGEVAATTLPQLLREIALDLQLSKEGRLTLRELSAKAGSGSLQSSGQIDVRGGQLRDVKLSAHAKNFPVAAGAYSVWLDTQVDLEGHSDGHVLRTRIHIPSGNVQVPKLSAGQNVQALGPLADVEFVDAAGRRTRAEALAAEQAEQREAGPRKPVPFLPEHTQVTVEMPGPFVINGPEVKTDLQGHVDAEMNSEGGTRGAPIIRGDLHALNGWLEILGRRYQIDRAQVSLSGDVPPNPLLDISISRKVEDATIYILVTGTAQKPIISFRSDPATYDQGQIIAMVLSGSSRGGGTIQQQALGALSSLVVGKLKDQLGAAVPVDVIKFDVGGSDAMGANQSSIEIGKYLRDNLYLSYTHRFGNPSTILRRLNNDQVALEWWFLRNYQLHIMGGDQGVGSLNVYWYKRF